MNSRAPESFPVRIISLLLFLYASVYLIFLGIPRIGGSSEAREAQVIDVIIRDGEWILPLRNGIVPSKPILFHWFGATTSLILGEVSELTVRIPSLLFGVGVLLLSSFSAFRLAERVREPGGSARSGVAAVTTVGVLTLTYGFHIMASQAMVDMTFALFVWGAFLALISSSREEWCENRRVSKGARALFWSACAGAMLARGPAGAAFPLIVSAIVGAIVLGPRVVVREIFRPSIGWLAFALPVAWYALAYMKGGGAFVDRQLFFENVRRFIGGEHVNSEVWWFYLPSLVRNTFPWGVIVALMVLRTLVDRITSHPGGGARNFYRLVPTIALAAGVSLLSLSSGKRHSYLLPLHPCVAIQLGIFAASAFNGGGWAFGQRLAHLARKLEATAVGVAVVGLLTLGLMVWVIPTRTPIDTEIRAVLAARSPLVGIVLMVAVLVSLLSCPKSGFRSLACFWFAMVALITSVVSSGASVKAHLKNFHGMGSAWLAELREGEVLTLIKGRYDEYFDPILWNVHRPVELFMEPSVPPCHTSRLYLARREWLESFSDQLSGTVSRHGELQELGSTLRGRRGDSLVIFRCSPNKIVESSSTYPQTADWHLPDDIS